MKNCTDELMNPSTDLKMWERGNLPVQICCGGMRRTLVHFRLMQRPLSMQCSKVEGGGGASELEHREEEEEARKGEKERTPEPIYKANGQGNRGD